MKPLLLLFSLFALFACSTNPYHPYSDNVGYSDAKRSGNTYEVMFHGSDNLDELGAMKLAEVRAAEIAQREDFPYFRIDSVKTSEKQVQKTYVTSDPYYYNYGPYGWYNGPYYGWGGYYNSGCNAVTRTEDRPVVRMTFTLEREACGDCISTNEKMQQAAASGIIPRDKG